MSVTLDDPSINSNAKEQNIRNMKENLTHQIFSDY